MQGRITVRIGNETRDLEQADAQWVHQSIKLRERDGGAPCVAVSFDTGDLKMTVASAGCAPPGGGRRPSAEEQRMFDLWNKLGLSAPGANLLQLWRFLQQVRGLLGLRGA